MFEIFHDGAFELGDAFEGAAADTFSSDLGEEALDHVEPGSRGGREVQVEARMRLEPALYRRGFVGGVVVHDQVEVELGGGVRSAGPVEAHEFPRSVPPVT